MVDVTDGVSVLGPTLWNLTYDWVLNCEYGEGVTPFAFGDDFAMLVAARDREELLLRITCECVLVEDWMNEHDLFLAENKTEAVVLRGYKKRDRVEFKYERARVTPKKVRKVSESNSPSGWVGLTFEGVSRRAIQRMAALGKIMPNIGGPKSKRRRAFHGVVQSVVFYGVPV
ncbi:uncharacterized protein [Diabrotica undecimpunctata]|uniref:uncharacterized protein n=1 Tax=Diabrotica undecimpunctata TaxID=50387 RepID=UPI003B633976